MKKGGLSITVTYMLVYVTLTVSGNVESDYLKYGADRTLEEYRYVRAKVAEIEIEALKKSGAPQKDVHNIVENENSAMHQDVKHGSIGDILLSGEDIDDWRDGKHSRNKRKIFDFSNDRSRKWDLPIKYMIDSTTIVNVTGQAIIKAAIAAWEENTCIPFEEVESEPKEKYLFFTNNKNMGCSSYVGKRGYYSHVGSVTSFLVNRQPVHLSYPGCYVVGGIAMHEIGHALGLYHEVQRVDRGRYIRILDENIKRGVESNFEVGMNQRTWGVPYDLGSVMHYSALDFSKNVADLDITIIPWETEKYFVMGQRSELSFYDVKVINLAYCPVSRKSSLGCKNQGYPDPNNSAKCKCLAEFEGDRCERIAKSSDGCAPSGGVYHHNETDVGREFSLSTPNYMDWENWAYERGDQCFWDIQVPRGYQIQWHISIQHTANTEYFLGMAQLNLGCFDWLEIRKPEETRGERICGLYNDTKDAVDWQKPHLTHQPRLHISFRSFNSLYSCDQHRQELRRGVHLVYSIVENEVTSPTSTSTTTTESAYKSHLWHQYSKTRRYNLLAHNAQSAEQVDICLPDLPATPNTFLYGQRTPTKHLKSTTENDAIHTAHENQPTTTNSHDITLFTNETQPEVTTQEYHPFHDHDDKTNQLNDRIGFEPSANVSSGDSFDPSTVVALYLVIPFSTMFIIGGAVFIMKKLTSNYNAPNAVLV